MLDIRRLRTEPDAVRAGLSRRGGDAAASVDRILDLDVRQRALGTERDDLRARIKVLSKEVGQRRGQGDADGAEALMAESRALGERERALDAEVELITAEVRDLLLRTPNVPSPDCPDGAGEADNVVLRIEGFDPDAYEPHQRVPHWDIGTELGILDGERAAKIAGSMFTMYRGWGARLLRAMVQLSLDRNADAFEEIRPPTLVRTDTMIATGHLPKFEDEAYHMERDDLWAIPTAEVPLTSMHRDEVLDDAELPRRYTAHTSCFRREAGAAGRDTRGLLRVHEFDKVELLAVANGAEQAIACQEDILARSEALLAELGLPYRILDLCTGDVGASAGAHLGHRGLRTGLRPVARGELGVVVHRLPGPAGQHPLPPQGRQGHGGVPHRERIGHGLVAHAGGVPRDASPARRLDRGGEAAAGLPGRRGHQRSSLSRARRRMANVRRHQRSDGGSACRSTGPGSA